MDSSALVKLYHAEAGTPVVDQMARLGFNTLRISRLTIAELASAFAIKVRTHAISRENAHQVLRQFGEDIVVGKLEVFSITEATFSLAESLIERYAFDLRLRTLDGIQLAVALTLRNNGLVDHFVAADKILCHVAAMEGLAVINPES